jgi:hypothetical protein
MCAAGFSQCVRKLECFKADARKLSWAGKAAAPQS